MSKIVTQDKLNELTGMSIDYGKGGGYCPHYQTIVSLWGSVVASSNYQPNQLVKEEDMGRLIGKNGKIINAIRTLCQASSYLNGNKYVKINADKF